MFGKPTPGHPCITTPRLPTAVPPRCVWDMRGVWDACADCADCAACDACDACDDGGDGAACSAWR
jgi:hypothetical protein